MQWLFLIIIVLLEWIADVFLYLWAKLSAQQAITVTSSIITRLYEWAKQSNLQANICLAIGILLYVFGVYFWAVLLQYDKLSVLSIVYSAAVIITTILLAYMVFNESWDWKKIIAILFCILAIIFAEV